MERGIIMNTDINIVITLLIILGTLIFLIGTQIGRVIGQREMDDVIRMHKLVSNIWKELLLRKTTEYTALLREYIKLTKE